MTRRLTAPVVVASVLAMALAAGGCTRGKVARTSPVPPEPVAEVDAATIENKLDRALVAIVRAFRSTADPAVQTAAVQAAAAREQVPLSAEGVEVQIYLADGAESDAFRARVTAIGGRVETGGSLVVFAVIPPRAVMVLAGRAEVLSIAAARPILFPAGRSR